VTEQEVAEHAPDNGLEQGAAPDAATLKQRSVRGAAATMVSQGIRIVLQFGSQIALARLLLPGEVGLVALVGPLLGFVAIFTELGLTQATVQRESITQSELSGLFWISTTIGAVLAGVMCAMAPLAAAFYHEPRLTPVAMALAGLLVLAGMAAQPIAVMNRNMRFVPLAVLDIGCSVASAVVGIGAAWAGMGYWSLVLMQAANGVAILVFAWTLSGWRPSAPRWDPGVAALLRFGGHMTAFNLVSFAGSNLDSILIGRLRGNVSLGLYDRAFKLVAAPIWTLSIPIARVAVSLLSRLQTAPDRYRHAYLQMLQVLLLVTLPAVAFTAVAAGTVVPFLLGPAWAEAAPIVAWLAVATGFAPLSISASWLFVSQGRGGEQTGYAVARTALSITALLCGLPWGVVGVAQAYAAFGLVVHGVPLWGATRRGPVALADAAAACAPLAVAAAVAALAVRLAEQEMQLHGIPPWAQLLLGAAAAYTAFGAALMTMPGGARLLRGAWALRSAVRAAPAAG